MFIFPKKLTLEKFIQLVKSQEKIGLSFSAAKKLEKVRKEIEKIVAANKSVYGINTGFGGLSNKLIPKEKLTELQENLILSHACGVGNPLPQNMARGVLLLLINSLSKGYSGITPETLGALIKIYNKGIIPYIPEKGSVGASGDLAPLAHLSLILLGKGKAYYKNSAIDGSYALKLCGLKPLKLKPKEGLALINGTHAMASLLAFAVEQAKNISYHADVASAMTCEALKANPIFLDSKIHSLKPFPGQIETAKNLSRLIQGSAVVKKNVCAADGKTQIQDAYSIRCAPQVHGASKDVISFAEKIAATEINSVTDNPLFIGGEFISGGNFHGQSLAMAADFLSIAVSELSDISERRIDRLVNPILNGANPFLIKNSGINCGFMVTQYLAVALVSQNQVLCHPAVVDSIPTSGQQEDHVSMGMNACLKLREVLDNVQKVLAIELLCAAQAIDLQSAVQKIGKGTKISHQIIRKHIPFLEKDRVLSYDIEKADDLIEKEEIINEIKIYEKSRK